MPDSLPAMNNVSSTIANLAKSTELAVSNETTVLSVDQLNHQIRQLIEGELSLVWVQGEISNFKAHTSGHFYFSLKDSKSQISAVMFRGFNSRLKFKPVDGLEVIVRGKVTVYEPRGNYQIVCETIEPVGAGALQKAFEQLKEKLKGEGLFEASKKRPMPALPRHVAIVTSPTGAAIRDMLNVLSRRNKSVQITVVPTIVQGEAAAPLICEALNKAFRLPNVDVVIVGRGGGSIEDLWAFNDEKLARLIAGSPIPVISAVGHEIDFTIADFVADLRAPTPSAAAELVAKNAADLGNRLLSMERLLKISMSKVLRGLEQQLKGWSARLTDPKRKLQDLILRNDELFSRLSQAVFSYFEHRRMALQILQGRLVSPQQVVLRKQQQLKLAETRLGAFLQRSMEKKKSQLEKWMSVLQSLSPLKVVERGYSVTTKDSLLIKTTKQLKIGDLVEVKLMQGSIQAEVKKLS